jgi:hypothetical protein
VKWGVLLEATMGQNGVPVGTPGIDDLLGVGERLKPVEAEALVPELAVEALDEGLLDGPARPEGLEGHAALVGPEVEGLTSDFRAIVTPNAAGQAAVTCAPSRDHYEV